MKSKLPVFDICLIGIFVALNAAFAQITIPTVIPLTMQTFAVPLTGAVLGARKGSIAIGVYILLGLAIPIYSPGATAGLARLASPTGGFLLIFPLYAAIVGFAANREKHRRVWLAGSLIIGAIVMFAFGGVVFPLLLGFATSVQMALAGWVVPFLLGDLIKIAGVFAIAPVLRKALKNMSSSSLRSG